MYPSPNVHVQEVGELVEVSLNTTVRGTVPEVILEVKETTGADTALTVI